MHPLPPLSLYVHIPWCVRKCPYCDFNSHEVGARDSHALPEAEYLDAILRDLQQDAPLAQGRRLQSIFFGGGTPSLFRATTIEAMLKAFEQAFGFVSDIEITLEANPGATEYHNLQGLRAAGVNRLSMGVQSFQDQHLKALGRIHSATEALTAFQQARAAGFDNINLDLMHGLPGQDLKSAMSDLQQAVALGPEHLSWYQLTIEPNTHFYKVPPTLPDDSALADIQDEGHAYLEASGYTQYEVSAYAAKAQRSRHNLNYWAFGDYLALGAGAHGKITSERGIERYWKTRLPADYLRAGPTSTAGWQRIEDRDLPFEFMMNALRLVDGVPTAYFEPRTGLKLAAITAVRTRLEARGLLVEDPQRLQATSLGLRFLNDLLSAFAD